jgi:hypothetical protein
MDPIESQRRRKRARKRGSARDFHCPVIGEQVLIALRRRTGAVRWQDAFVWCSQDQCQYSGSNVPPCPLHPGLLQPDQSRAISGGCSALLQRATCPA